MGVHNHLPLLLDRDLMTITEESLFEVIIVWFLFFLLRFSSSANFTNSLIVNFDILELKKKRIILNNCHLNRCINITNMVILGWIRKWGWESIYLQSSEIIFGHAQGSAICSSWISSSHQCSCHFCSADCSWAYWAGTRMCSLYAIPGQLNLYFFSLIHF